ncbi:MAG TPA: hypothetical protein VGD67_10825 [Pseudonocardiaceae bacterium]
MNPAVAVVGTHVSYLDDPDRNLEEVLFEASNATLAAAGITMDDVDAIVVSCTDQVDGRVIEGMVAAGPTGGVGRDLTITPSASEHAFVLGYLRLLAGLGSTGLGSTVLTMSWSKPSEGVDPRHAELVMAEPFLLRPLGMNLAIAAGLQASAYQAAHGGVAGPDAPAAGVVAWPLTRADLPGSADVVAGAVLTTEPGDRPATWIRGAGWASDRYELGERDLTRLAALGTAADTAYRAAGITDPAAAVDHAEVQRLSRVGLLAAYRELGLPPPDPEPEPLPEGVPAAGFVRLARAAAHGIAHPGTTTVGAALHGFAGQGAAVVVFGGRP